MTCLHSHYKFFNGKIGIKTHQRCSVVNMLMKKHGRLRLLEFMKNKKWIRVKEITSLKKQGYLMSFFIIFSHIWSIPLLHNRIVTIILVSTPDWWDLSSDINHDTRAIWWVASVINLLEDSNNCYLFNEHTISSLGHHYSALYLIFVYQLCATMERIGLY